MEQDSKKPQVALITGAAKRIGRAIALHLARSGWDIAIHYHNSFDDAQSAEQEIRALGQRAKIFQADLQIPEATIQLMNRCVDELGAPCCLINNGSIFQNDTIDTLTMSSWQNHISINLQAPILLAQSFAKAFPNNTVGNIINIIDQRVWKLTPNHFSYTISKSALWTATRTLSQALAPNIRVNAIGPGPVLRSTHQDEKQFAAQQDATLLNHPTSPLDIAHTVEFILTSPALTGQMIALDSGQHLAWRTADVVGLE